MKLRVHKIFRFMRGHDEITVRPGEFEVPGGPYSKEEATMIVKHKCGKWIHEKKAPENKVVAPAEEKIVVRTTSKKAYKKKKVRARPTFSEE